MTAKHTVKDMVDWIIEHRKGKAFEGWSPIEIAQALVDAIQDNGFSYTVDGNTGNITGIVHGRAFHGEHVFYIYNILATAPEAMSKFLTVFERHYPGWTIEARRHGRVLRYTNMKRFFQLINRLTR